MLHEITNNKSVVLLSVKMQALFSYTDLLYRFCVATSRAMHFSCVGRATLVGALFNINTKET